VTDFQLTLSKLSVIASLEHWRTPEYTRDSSRRITASSTLLEESLKKVYCDLFSEQYLSSEGQSVCSSFLNFSWRYSGYCWFEI